MFPSKYFHGGRRGLRPGSFGLPGSGANYEIRERKARRIPRKVKSSGAVRIPRASAKNGASPPVATIVGLRAFPQAGSEAESSSRIRPTAPRSTPKRIVSTVLLPGCSGSWVENGISGSCAVPAARLRRIMARPGAIAPPRKTPSASTISSVSAVPQSAEMPGSGNSSARARALATRSAPPRCREAETVPPGQGRWPPGRRRGSRRPPG